MPEYSNEAIDKGKWHYGGDYSDDLPAEDGLTHIAMFFGSSVDNGLVSEQFTNDEIIAKFRRREASLHQLIDWFDEVLVGDMLTSLGSAFAHDYYAGEGKGCYFEDYEKTLCKKQPSLYHVEPTFDNHNRMCKVIGRRFKKWVRKNS